jgi:eukaryotic-like serine/threonine-protein kinase
MVERGPRATDTDGLLLGDFAPGSRIGEYLVEHVLATRGTGHIYQAIHRVLPRRVTIKVMPATQAATRALALELLREACIVEALDHPGIPRVYECGVLADRRPWIATELVAGTTLANRRDQGKLSIFEVAAIVRDLAEILAHAHARGLVHHGVVPDAIVFPDEARRFPVCLVDWSGARTRDSRTPLPMLPRAGARPYLAPEHARGDAIDERADVYALGAIARELFELAVPTTCPPILAALVARMVDDHPDARPSAGTVCEHAAWVAAEIDPTSAMELEVDPAVPQPIDEERTEVLLHDLVRPQRAPAIVRETDS